MWPRECNYFLNLPRYETNQRIIFVNLCHERNSYRWFKYPRHGHHHRQLQKEKNRILIVDDDPEVTESFGLVLEDSGLFQVAKYSDPMLALSNFRPNLYDVVLLDVKMPNVDSFGLYNKMKRIDSKVKVFFICIYDKQEA
jgi:PleD family two-component response regulator